MLFGSRNDRSLASHDLRGASNPACSLATSAAGSASSSPQNWPISRVMLKSKNSARPALRANSRLAKDAIWAALSPVSPVASRSWNASERRDVVRLHDLVFCENPLKRIAGIAEAFLGSLLTVDDHQDQFDAGARSLDGLSRFQERVAGRCH